MPPNPADVWEVVAGDVLYASRPTKEEAEQVIEEQGHLARKFGLPVRVEHRVIELRALGDHARG